jgi:hypothetical protein
MRVDALPFRRMALPTSANRRVATQVEEVFTTLGGVST